MADVLSQGEVEALLSAMDPEAMDSEEPPKGPSGAKAGSSGKHRKVPLPTEITRYDFKRPERMGKEHQQALRSIHESFARTTGTALSGQLRTVVEFKLVSVDQMTYSEFISSLENPTSLNVLTCEPLKGYLVFEINPSIVHPIIDRMLGGGQFGLKVPRRPLSDIEVKLVNRIIDQALEELSVAWAPILDIKFATDRIESNPFLVQIVPPNEVVVLLSFEIVIGEMRGMANLCIPFNVVEPVSNQLAANTWITQTEMKESMKDQVMLRLNNAPLDVVVHLGETSITADDLMNLQVGDLFPIEKSSRSKLLVTIAGVPKFRGTVFRLHGRKVIRLDETCERYARINS